MGWFGERAPRLGDVRESQPQLAKSRKAVFFAPHTSERMATLPLISKVSERLERCGVSCTTHSVEDMREHVISLSVRLSRLRLGKDEMPVLERLLRLKDASIRLGIVCRILEANPDAMFIEVHSLDRDYRTADRFPYADYFTRLPGTRILFLRDFPGEYFRPMATGARLIGSIRNGSLREAIGFIGLEQGYIERQSIAQLGYLSKNAHRSSLVEIPAPSSMAKEDEGRLTPFERCYGLALSSMHTITDGEIDALAKTLL